MAFTGRLRELMKKYGKVALGVHFSVSAASITGMYVAIKNNVDVESLLSKVGISGVSKEEEEEAAAAAAAAEKRIETSDKGFILEQGGGEGEEHTHIIITEDPPLPQSVTTTTTTTTTTTKEEKMSRTTELAASSGGALALAILCNKALFPVRVPITIALTPPIARFLARRKIIKNHV